jgi:hypothetical protein
MDMGIIHSSRRLMMGLWLWLMGISFLPHFFLLSPFLFLCRFIFNWENEGKLTPNRAFLNKVVNFLGVGLALYAIASAYELFSSDPIIKHTVKCAYCRKWISVKACLTSHLWLRGRVEWCTDVCVCDRQSDV